VTIDPVERPLADLAFARPGDKGDTSDISLFAADAEVFALLLDQVTAERVRRLYGELVQGAVTRYEAPGVLALKFVMTGALSGGGPSSLRADNLGKALGGALLRLSILVPADISARLGDRARPPRDPYDSAAWVIRD